MSGRQQVEEFLPLPASVMHIAVALAEGEKHGYAILRDVAELSGGAVRMGSGTLYGSIRRMLRSRTASVNARGCMRPKEPAKCHAS